MGIIARAIVADRRTRFGLGLVGILVIVAALAPVFAPYDPTAQLDLAARRLLPPSLNHLFGTDNFSRDILSRVLYGAGVSLSVGCLSILVSLTIGTCVGLVAGYVGGIVDTLLMRVVDAGLAVPRIILLLVFLALWQRVELIGLVAILGLTSWFGTSRIVRAEVLSLRSREFMVATRSLGLGHRRTLIRHLLPNVVAPVAVTGTLGIGQVILIEAGISYLGLGLQEPTASLGRMIAQGTEYLLTAPWMAIFPGTAIVLIVIGFSLLGDGLRTAMDPRYR